MTESTIADVPTSAPTGENRVAIVAVATLGAGAGLLPIALMVGEWRYFVFFWPYAALCAAWETYRSRRLAGPAPSRTILELLLAVTSSAFLYLIAASIATLFGSVMFFAARLVNLAVGGAGWHWQAPAQSISSWAGVISAAFFVAVGGSVVLDELRERLYSPQPDGRSSFHTPGVLQARKTWVKVGACAVAIVFIWFVGRGSLSTYPAGMLAYLFLLTVGARARRYGDRPSGENLGIAAAVALFRQLGYTTLTRPRTLDGPVDRMLSGLDLVISKGDQSLAFTVKAASADGRPVSWTAGAGHLSAVDAFTAKIPRYAGIEPVILLVGAVADESLVSFAHDEGLRLMSLGIDQAQKIVKSANPVEIAALAENLLSGEPGATGSAEKGAVS